MNKVAFLGGILLASLAMAEDQTTTVASGTTEAAAPVAASSGIVGAADLRPSWTPRVGGFRTENNLQLGYQINPTLTVKGVYDVNFVEKDNGDLDTDSLGLHARTDVKNIAELGAFNLSYQNRTYVPVNTAKREQGMITTVRNYFNFKTQLAENVSLTIAEVPMFHIYNRAGTAAGGSPVVENRIYVMPTIALGKVSIDPALWWSLRKHRTFDQAAVNNGTWTNHLEFDLDVTYAFTDKISAGFGYYSDNLISAMPNGEARGLKISDGILNGSPQIVLSMSL